MKSIVPLASFERCLKKLDPQAKSKLKHALEKFNEFIISGNPFKGLGFKMSRQIRNVRFLPN